MRNAILDLAQREDWARRWVNVGRLSVATVYERSPLNREKGRFESSLAQPGAAALDGLCRKDFFVDRLKGEFCVVLFRPEQREEPLHTRYGVPPEGATYVFRPDGHVLARCTGIDEAFAREAIDAVFNYRIGHKGSEPAMPAPTGRLSQIEVDRLYDELAAFIDATPKGQRERALTRAIVALAERLDDYQKVLEAIRNSGTEP